MLYQRILTATPLAVLVAWIIFFQPSVVFFYFVLFIVLIAAYEWAKLSGVQNIFLKAAFAIFMGITVWLIQQYAQNYRLWIIYAAVLWWFGVTFYLQKAKPKAVSSELNVYKLLAAFIVLPAATLAMRDIHALDQGAYWLFFAISLVWMADNGAYFSGKKFGKHKLAPDISPGKTKEGLLGAIIATSLYTLLASYYFGLNSEKTAFLMLLSIILTFISVTGDLYFSFLKREAGVKDSGNILPGHGGILDRIDSVLAAMPVFIAGYNCLILTGCLHLLDY